jgi:hypothetical protein
VVQFSLAPSVDRAGHCRAVDLELVPFPAVVDALPSRRKPRPPRASRKDKDKDKESARDTDGAESEGTPSKGAPSPELGQLRSLPSEHHSVVPFKEELISYAPEAVEGDAQLGVGDEVLVQAVSRGARGILERRVALALRLVRKAEVAATAPSPSPSPPPQPQPQPSSAPTETPAAAPAPAPAPAP